MEENKTYALHVLSDTLRLPEIYKLRVEAWQASQSNNIINQNKYPEGFTDEFDDISVHLIATDHNSDKIMSACRVTFFPTLETYPYIGLSNIEGFPNANIALIGRGVRDINFRHKRLQYDFVSLSLDICKENKIEYATGHAYNENVYMQNLMLDLGFKFLCNVEPENYGNTNMAYPGRLFIADLKSLP